MSIGIGCLIVWIIGMFVVSVWLWKTGSDASLSEDEHLPAIVYLGAIAFWPLLAAMKIIVYDIDMFRWLRSFAQRFR